MHSQQNIQYVWWSFFVCGDKTGHAMQHAISYATKHILELYSPNLFETFKKNTLFV
jgi:hypothetical protein